MKGDFSRLPYPFQRRYSGVWMQQGRVQLDSDWNEQLQIASQIARAGFRDAFGEGGAPRANAGFRIYVQRGLGFREGAAAVVDAGDGICRPGDPFAVTLTVERAAADEGPSTLAALRGVWSLGLDARGAVTFRVGEPRRDAPVLVSPAPLEPGAPAVVEAAWDGETATLTIDGEMAHTSRIRPEFGAPRGAPLTLGAARTEGGRLEQPFTGTLAGVRVWQDAERQVLAGAWPLDDGGGASARDTSGNGRHARLTAGGCGCPEWRPPQLWIGPGRYWVDGILCENTRPVRFCHQPDYPGAGQPVSGDWLLYLDVWERYLSAAQDPAIVEVALGGPDTTGRTQTVWQVRAQPLLPDADPLLRPGRGEDARLGARRDPPAGSSAGGGNRLYRVEVHGEGGAYRSARPDGPAARVTRIATDPRNPGRARLRLRQADAEPFAWAAGQRAELYREGMAAAGPLLTLLEVRDGGGEVEVDGLEGGWTAGDDTRLRPIATFTWSRDNAWVALAIRTLHCATGVVELKAQQPDPFDLRAGDWVEVCDDRRTLLGIPGPLRQVRSVDRQADTVVLDSPLPRDTLPRGGGHPLLRRWDALPSQSPAVLVAPGEWTALDDGVQVMLTGRWFRTGDYWTIPLRAEAIDGIEWPGGAQGPAMLPPQGIAHARARLAVVRADTGHVQVLRDLRRIFAPLGENDAGGHVDGPLTVEGDLRVGGTIRGLLAPGLVGTEALADGAVDADKLQDFSVAPGKLADAAVTARTLADAAVGPHALADQAVTARALAAASVATDALQDGAVNGQKLLVSAVHRRHLADGAVSRAKLSPDVGVVPPGCYIFGETPDAPPGYTWTGLRVPAQAGRGQWAPRPPLPAAYAARCSCVEAAGYLWAVFDGGLVLVWDPASAAWKTAPPVPGGGAGWAVAALGTRIYVVGGTNGVSRDAVTRVLAYDLGARAWMQLAPLPQAYSGMTAAAAGGVLLATGGMDASGNATAATLAYDPGTSAWAARAPLATPRAGHAAAVLDGTLYALGGQGFAAYAPTGGPLASAEAYDPQADAWRPCKPMQTPRVSLGAAAAAGRVWAVAGEGAGTSVERYDPHTDSWEAGPDLPAPRVAAGVASVAGALVAAGGMSGTTWSADVVEHRPAPMLYAYRRTPPVPPPVYTGTIRVTAT